MPTMTVTREVTAEITIYITGSRLTVVVQNAKMLVSDMEMSSVLLGFLLDHLGFIFTKYLSDSYEFFLDNHTNKKVRESAYTGVV